jgi:molecular chaperone GrpE
MSREPVSPSSALESEPVVPKLWTRFFANTTMTPTDPQARQAPALDPIAPAAVSNNNAPESQPDVRLAELQAKHAEVSDAFLRAKAEAENTRRRAEEEITKARKFALESFAESLLPVRDSLEATTAIADASNEQLLQGVHATLKLLTQALERNRIVEINPPTGTRFDPHQHQAISVVPADQEANTIVAVLQKGYLIAERVLRPALVTVAAPK